MTDLNPPPPPVIPGVRLRPIDGWPDYLVGDDGRLWSCKHKGRSRKNPPPPRKWKPLLANVHKSTGYVTVGLTKSRKMRVFRVHRLVLEAFVGPRPPGMECRHENGVATDNRLSNISWGTPAQNTEDRGRHGTQLMGSRCPAAKLDESKVAEILLLLQSRRTSKAEIAARFDICWQIIHKIARGEKWKHVPRPQPQTA